MTRHGGCWDPKILQDLSYRQVMDMLRRAARQGFELKLRQHPK